MPATHTTAPAGSPNPQEGTMPAPTILILDHVGLLTAADGMAYYLTSCCKASVKGSANSPTGACCRSCYQPVSPDMGAGWLTTDAAAWGRWEAAFVAAAEADHPDNVNSPIIAKMVRRTREWAIG